MLLRFTALHVRLAALVFQGISMVLMFAALALEGLLIEFAVKVHVVDGQRGAAAAEHVRQVAEEVENTVASAMGSRAGSDAEDSDEEEGVKENEDSETEYEYEDAEHYEDAEDADDEDEEEVETSEDFGTFVQDLCKFTLTHWQPSFPFCSSALQDANAVFRRSRSSRALGVVVASGGSPLRLG